MLRQQASHTPSFGGFGLSHKLSDDRDIVDKITTLRNQQVAHHDIKPILTDPPKVGEISEFINLLEEVANKLEYAHDQSCYSRGSNRSNAKAQTQGILRILRNHEAAIHAEYDQEDNDLRAEL